MKKHAIAAAISAAFALPAVAQVTVTGTLDIVPHVSTKQLIGGSSANEGRKITRTDSGGGGWSTSVLNFTATEDLGAGLKATAFVNQVINQTDGLLTARDRWVQLQTAGAGTLKAGRFSPAIEGYGTYAVAGTANAAGTTDSSGYDFITGSLGYADAYSRAINTAQVNTVRTGLDGEFDRAAADMGRQSGVVQYTTPTFNGFSATAEYIKNSADRDASARTGKAERSQQALRLDFTQGNLAVSVAQGKNKVTREAAAQSNMYYLNGTSNGVAANTELANTSTNPYISGTPAIDVREVKSDVTWFGASYNFGFARVLLAHGMREDETNANNAGASKTSDLKVSNIGLIVPLGAVTLTASYYDGDDARASTDATRVNLKGHQLGARYALSKRTFGYIVTGENKATLQSGSGTAANNTKIEGTSIGVVHTF